MRLRKDGRGHSRADRKEPRHKRACSLRTTATWDSRCMVRKVSKAPHRCHQKLSVRIPTQQDPLLRSPINKSSEVCLSSRTRFRLRLAAPYCRRTWAMPLRLWARHLMVLRLVRSLALVLKNGDLLNSTTP